MKNRSNNSEKNEKSSAKNSEKNGAKSKIDSGINQLNAYFRTMFFPDIKAGFITAIVALRLAIAFAIASGVSPVMGLF